MEGQAETRGTSGALKGLAKTRRDKQSQAGLCRDKKGHGGTSSGKQRQAETWKDMPKKDKQRLWRTNRD